MFYHINIQILRYVFKSGDVDTNMSFFLFSFLIITSAIGEFKTLFLRFPGNVYKRVLTIFWPFLTLLHDLVRGLYQRRSVFLADILDHTTYHQGCFKV